MEKMLQIFQFVGAVLGTASAAFIIYDRLVPDQDHGCHRAQVARDAQDLQPRRRSIGHSEPGYTFIVADEYKLIVAVRERATPENCSTTSTSVVGKKQAMNMDDDITSIYKLLDAIEAVIKAADPAKREALAHTIDAYAGDFPEDFFWATGSQAPTLLHHLLNTIDSACRPEAQSKPRPAIRLVDRKPEGNG